MKPFEGYLGNPNLKPANVVLKLTQEQVLEIAKCAEDPVYFIKNYIKIVNVDRGLINFQLYPYQEHWIDLIDNNRFVVGMWSRQTGKSTSSIAYLLWYILFNRMTSVAILANKADTAQELLYRLQLAYEHLPHWLQQGIVTWNKRNIELENGSKIKAAATSSASVRGGSYNCIVLDEFAHIDNKLADQFFTSVYPTISSGQSTKVIVTSTPLGMNHFHKMWIDATKAQDLRKKNKDKEANKISRFVPYEVLWDEVPGHDEDWKEQEIANLGSEEKFAQEYENEFIGSTDTLIRTKTLKELVNAYKQPISEYDGLFIYEEPLIDRDKDKDGEPILKPHRYLICVDTSYGKELDYSAFSVVDITNIPYKVVASYRNNRIVPLAYSDFIYQIATKYNKAFVLIEVNDIGQTVANSLHNDLEYDNILTCTTKGRQGQQLSTGYSKTVQYGVKMTKVVKKTGCVNLKSLLEFNKLKVVDFHTLSELTTFIRVGQTYQAEEGNHDDLVMTLVMFSWVVSQKYFKELTTLDIRLSLQQSVEEQEENLRLPPPIVDDGLNLGIPAWFDPWEARESEAIQGDLWRPVNQLGSTWWNNF